MSNFSSNNKREGIKLQDELIRLLWTARAVDSCTRLYLIEIQDLKMIMNTSDGKAKHREIDRQKEICFPRRNPFSPH